MEDNFTVCPVCLAKKMSDGTFRFSYKPNTIISADDVAGLICSNVSKKRPQISMGCINLKGNPELGDTWDKRLSEKY